MLREHRVVAARVELDGRTRALVADVAGGHERVPLQPAAVVAGDVEALELVDPSAEPVDQVDVCGAVGRDVGAAALDAAVPRAHVLADVTAVHLRAHRLPVLERDRLRHLRPVGEATRRVERPRLVERAGRARVDADPTRAAVGLERRRRVELGGGDERAEHDPRAVPACDQHRVLAVEADARPRRRLAVDVLVRVDEHEVRGAQLAAEPVEFLAQLRIAVVPRVPRQAPVARGPVRLRRPVAERRRDDAPRPREQPFRMAGDLRLGNREAQAAEEAARPAFTDVTLGRVVGHGTRDADRVEAELFPQAPHLRGRHRRIVPAVPAAMMAP